MGSGPLCWSLTTTPVVLLKSQFKKLVAKSNIILQLLLLHSSQFKTLVEKNNIILQVC